MAILAFPSFSSLSTNKSARYLTLTEGNIKDRMRYVLFIPKSFDTFSAVASGVNGLTNRSTIGSYLEAIVSTALNAVQSASAIDTSKDKFVNDLKGIKLQGGTDSNDVVIALPFKQEFVNQVNHQMEWKMEKNRLDENFRAFTHVIDNGIKTVSDGVSGDFKGALGGIKGTGGAVVDYAKLAIKEGIINQAKEGFQGFNLGTLGLTAYTPMKKTFESVSTMSFDFEWDLTPRNKQDAATMINIIDAFRVLSYPWAEKDEAGQIKVAIIHQPALWDVVFPPYELDGTPDDNGTILNNLDNVGGSSPNIGRFANLIAKGNRFLCVIDGITLSYGSENPEAKYMVTLPDGTPNTIKMSVKMSEYFNVQSAFERFGTPATKFTRSGT